MTPFAATERLIAGGRRRIALIRSNRSMPWADELQSRIQRGGARSVSELSSLEGDLSTRFGRESTIDLLQRAKPPTAFILHHQVHRRWASWRALAQSRTTGRNRTSRHCRHDDINVSSYFTPPHYLSPTHLGSSGGRSDGSCCSAWPKRRSADALRQVFGTS